MRWEGIGDWKTAIVAQDREPNAARAPFLGLGAMSVDGQRGMKIAGDV